MTSGKKEPSDPGLPLPMPPPLAEPESPLEEPPELGAEDEEQESTVISLSADALSDDDSYPDGSSEDTPFSVPTQKGEDLYREQMKEDIAQAKASGFDEESTRVDTDPLPQTMQTLQLPIVNDKVISQGESQYRDMVEEDVSISKALGYDKEGTAIVPLAELARREEERLRRGEDLSEEPTDETRRSIPVGEVVDVLRAARSVEEAAGVLVEIVSNLIPRVLLLWERRGRLYGFASRGMELTEVKLLTMEMPKSILQEMTAADLDLDSFQGPPNTGGMVGKFFEILGGIPPEVLLIPIQVTASDRWMLYADNDRDPLPQLELRLLEVVASRAGARADWLLDRQTIW